jgi:hypothetical protein
MLISRLSIVHSFATTPMAIAASIAYPAKLGNVHLLASIHLVLGLLGTTEETSSASGDETGLLTLGGVA